MVAALGIVALSLLTVVGLMAYILYLSSGSPHSEDRR
jgi:hypothetical protein